MDNQSFIPPSEEDFQQFNQDFVPQEPDFQHTDDIINSLAEKKRGFKDQVQDYMVSEKQNLPELYKPYEHILSQYENIYLEKGQNEADKWLNEHMAGHGKVQSENNTLINELQQQYQDIYAVPEIKQAIDAYLNLDMDSSKSLKEQGFPEVVEYISSIYKAGFANAARLKNQNDSAKQRMDSSLKSGLTPASGGGRVFSREEIRKMDSETFSKYEKQIFDQMARGLIR